MHEICVRICFKGASMSDRKFKISVPETVTVAVHTVDKLLRAGDGDAALLYLYLLKTQGESTTGEAAEAIGKSVGWVASAMAVLSRIGLVKGGDDAPELLPHDTPPDAPSMELRRYTAEEIQREVKTGSDFSALVEETQRSLGKILSPDELERLFGIYDGLRLPAEVIMLLMTHCIAESRGRGGGRMPSMRYIEKAAYTWEREGIFSLNSAEEYLKALEARKNAHREIKEALQIRDRELSTTEKRYVDGWIAMGFGAAAVEIAYDITVLKTGKLAWGYMDAIVNSWHSKGLHTPHDILERDGKPAGKDTHGNQKDPAQRFGVPDRNELERMQRLLEKIKEN